ncbi:MAG: hypothetical protein WC624_00860 [Candidatus Margulisiibacteriota bacterium]
MGDFLIKGKALLQPTLEKNKRQVIKALKQLKRENLARALTRS